MLDRDDEYALAKAWRDHGDIEARNRIVEAYLPLAISAARSFSFRASDERDIEQEAVLGLFAALDRYDPELGWRFATYARWWITARARDYSLKNHSMVGVAGEKFRRIFFSIRKVYASVSQEMGLRSEGPGLAHEIRGEVARRLGVSPDELMEYESHILAADSSLNGPVGMFDDDEAGLEWIDTLEAEGSPEASYMEAELVSVTSAIIEKAMEDLDDREREIIRRRRLTEGKATTLAVLGEKFDISPERVRQIEKATIRKMKLRMSGDRRARDTLCL